MERKLILLSRTCLPKSNMSSLRLVKNAKEIAATAQAAFMRIGAVPSTILS